jgi:hypothetical protein
MSIISELKEELQTVLDLQTKLLNGNYTQEVKDELNSNYEFRLKGISERMEEYTSEWDEFVYILSKPSNPNMVKIGWTTFQPEKRLREINSATGIIEEWDLAWFLECADGRDLEQKVHEYLDEFRIRDNREGFSISVSQAVATIQKVNEDRY